MCSVFADVCGILHEEDLRCTTVLIAFDFDAAKRRRCESVLS